MVDLLDKESIKSERYGKNSFIRLKSYFTIFYIAAYFSTQSKKSIQVPILASSLAIHLLLIFSNDNRLINRVINVD